MELFNREKSHLNHIGLFKSKVSEQVARYGHINQPMLESLQQTWGIRPDEVSSILSDMGLVLDGTSCKPGYPESTIPFTSKPPSIYQDPEVHHAKHKSHGTNSDGEYVDKGDR